MGGATDYGVAAIVLLLLLYVFCSVAVVIDKVKVNSQLTLFYDLLLRR